MSSSDSESDFWNDDVLEKKSVGVSADINEVIEDPAKPADKAAEQLEECLNEVSDNEYFRERLQTLLTNLRIGSDEHLKIVLRTELSKQKRLYEKQLQSHIKKQQNDMLALKKDYDSLKSMLLMKDEEISYLQRLLIDQEFPLGKQRLYKKISIANQAENSKVQDESSLEFIEDIKALKLQMLGMKELVKSYQEQTQNAELNLKNCQSLLKATEEKAESDLKASDAEHKKIEASLRDMILELNKKYEQFKEEVRKELDISQIVIKHQVEANAILKQELKSAKMVLVTPRLRDKFLTKLKVNEIEPEEIKKPLRLKSKNLKNKDSTIDYLISTRGSPAIYSSQDINLNSSTPVVGLLPEISSRYISQ